MKPVLFYSLAGGVLIAVLRYIEYQHFVRAYPAELYGALVAVIFTVIGIYLGLRWTRRPNVLVPEVAVVRDDRPFEVNASSLQQTGITPRELEILGLIAEGLSNREIGERLFVSENTVKTHSSRVFDKLGVNRRMQAVQKGKDLGLIR